VGQTPVFPKASAFAAIPQLDFPKVSLIRPSKICQGLKAQSKIPGKHADFLWCLVDKGEGTKVLNNGSSIILIYLMRLISMHDNEKKNLCIYPINNENI